MKQYLITLVIVILGVIIADKISKMLPKKA